jgi:hypothetical protein
MTDARMAAGKRQELLTSGANRDGVESMDVAIKRKRQFVDSRLESEN